MLCPQSLAHCLAHNRCLKNSDVVNGTQAPRRSGRRGAHSVTGFIARHACWYVRSCFGCVSVGQGGALTWERSPVRAVLGSHSQIKGALNRIYFFYQCPVARDREQNFKVQNIILRLFSLALHRGLTPSNTGIYEVHSKATTHERHEIITLGEMG